jgi:steroid delta-isomerase-like uncharacterized protein
MSNTLETQARQMFDEVWNRGNTNLLSQLITSDYVNHDPVNQVKGIEGATELVSKYRSAFPDVWLEIDEMFSGGDANVVVRWSYKGTHRGALEGLAPTGRVVKGSGITIFRFAGDRIKAAYTSWDALGMMQQLGVVTLPGKASAAGV